MDSKRFPPLSGFLVDSVGGSIMSTKWVGRANSLENKWEIFVLGTGEIGGFWYNRLMGISLQQGYAAPAKAKDFKGQWIHGWNGEREYWPGIDKGPSQQAYSILSGYDFATAYIVWTKLTLMYRNRERSLWWVSTWLMEAFWILERLVNDSVTY